MKCDCGHPYCKDCDPTAGMVWCSHRSCYEYVYQDTGCEHVLERAIENAKRNVDSAKERLEELLKRKIK